MDRDGTTSAGGPAPTSGVALGQGAVLLGKYRIERKLGEGGMGEVYEAAHLTLGTRVALKFPLGRGRSARVAARLLREARVAASLDSDRIVRVLDVATVDDGTPVIILEYLEGRSLAEELAERGALPVGEVVDWLRQACAGLAEAHAQGIVHRDVKPSNLFLQRARGGGVRLKILDFGIAAIRAAMHGDGGSALTDSSVALGSPPYMSPEQIRGANVDARCDVWALGVTAFELLTGRLPFPGRGAALVAAIVADPAPPLPHEVVVSARLRSLVAQCMEKDAAKRPVDAAELGERLAALDGASGRRARVTWARAGGVVAVLAAAGVATWVSAAPKSERASAEIEPEAANTSRKSPEPDLEVPRARGGGRDQDPQEELPGEGDVLRRSLPPQKRRREPEPGPMELAPSGEERPSGASAPIAAAPAPSTDPIAPLGPMDSASLSKPKTTIVTPPKPASLPLPATATSAAPVESAPSPSPPPSLLDDRTF